MHFLACVLVDGSVEDLGEIMGRVYAAMDPYFEENPVVEDKVYLTEKDIDDMAAFYKVEETDRRDLIERLVEHMGDWNGGDGGIDEGGLYAVYRGNLEAKWDWFVTPSSTCRGTTRRTSGTPWRSRGPKLAGSSRSTHGSSLRRSTTIAREGKEGGRMEIETETARGSRWSMGRCPICGAELRPLGKTHISYSDDRIPAGLLVCRADEEHVVFVKMGPAVEVVVEEVQRDLAAHQRLRVPDLEEDMGADLWREWMEYWDRGESAR